jgi:hypothetical protein
VLTARIFAQARSAVSSCNDAEMGELPAVRASDADREGTVALLREHAAAGRLTLEEFTDRMSAAYLARTNDELADLTRDLPPTLAPVAMRRRPTRLVAALLGSTAREGRIRVRRRIGCLVGLGNIDLDLRQATLESDPITIVAVGALCTIDVYVPEGVEVDLRGFTLGGHRRTRGNDPVPLAGTPLVRVFAISILSGIDVWRVPIAWAQKSWSEVIRGIGSGEHKELGA